MNPACRSHSCRVESGQSGSRSAITTPRGTHRNSRHLRDRRQGVVCSPEQKRSEICHVDRCAGCRHSGPSGDGVCSRWCLSRWSPGRTCFGRDPWRSGRRRDRAGLLDLSAFLFPAGGCCMACGRPGTLPSQVAEALVWCDNRTARDFSPGPTVYASTNICQLRRRCDEADIPTAKRRVSLSPKP
jgi:hypothetical protein